MSFGPVKVFTCSVASAATLSGEVDLGKDWRSVYLEIASMTSNSQHHIQAAASSGGTYRRVKVANVSTGTVQTLDFAVASTATSTFIKIPVDGLQYVKVELTATADSGQSYRIVCGN